MSPHEASAPLCGGQGPCCQPAPRIRQMLVGGHGSHVTFTAPCPGGDMFFCRRCGCHATTRPRALLTPCKPLDAHGRYNLARIADRLHPYTGVPIGRPVRLVIGALRRARGAPVELPVGPPPVDSQGVHPSRGTKRRRQEALDDVPISIRTRLAYAAERVLHDHVQAVACSPLASGPHPAPSGQPGQPGDSGVARWADHRVQLTTTAVLAHTAAAGGVTPAQHDWDNSQGTLASEPSPQSCHDQPDTPELLFEAFASPP